MSAPRVGLTYVFYGNYKSAWHLFNMMRILGVLSERDAGNCIISIEQRF